MGSSVASNSSINLSQSKRATVTVKESDDACSRWLEIYSGELHWMQFRLSRDQFAMLADKCSQAVQDMDELASPQPKLVGQ